MTECKPIENTKGIPKLDTPNTRQKRFTLTVKIGVINTRDKGGYPHYKYPHTIHTHTIGRGRGKAEDDEVVSMKKHSKSRI